jgi:hypothetical protein
LKFKIFFAIHRHEKKKKKQKVNFDALKRADREKVERKGATAKSQRKKRKKKKKRKKNSQRK